MVLVNRDGGDQPVGAAAKSFQRCRCLFLVPGFVKPPAVQFEDLIGADDIGAGVSCGDGRRLGPGQGLGGLFDPDSVFSEFFLQRFLVDGGGVDPMVDTGIFQYSAAYPAAGREDDTVRAMAGATQENSSLRRL